MHTELGQILDKRYKETKKRRCHFWTAWSKGFGGKSKVLIMPPTHNTTREVGKPPMLSFCPNSWTHPYTYSISGTSSTQQGSKQGNLSLVLTPHCCSRNPNKALPEFLVWLVVNFYWLGKAKKPSQYHEYNDENCLDLTDSEESHEPSDHILRLSDLDFPLSNMTWSHSINQFLHVFLQDEGNLDWVTFWNCLQFSNRKTND